MWYDIYNRGKYVTGTVVKMPKAPGANGLALLSFSYRQSGGSNGGRYSLRLAYSRGEWHITEEGKEFWSCDDEVINTYPVAQADVDGFVRYLESVDFSVWDGLPQGDWFDRDGPVAHIGFTVKDADNIEQYYAVSDTDVLPPEQASLFRDVLERLQPLCRFHKG